MTARASLVALALALVACSSNNSKKTTVPTDSGGFEDSPAGCSVFVTFNPSTPIAGPSATVRATANVTGALGVLTYAWAVSQGGNAVPFTAAQADNSAIDFPTTTAGVYDIKLDVTAASLCNAVDMPLNVSAPNANVADYRMRVIAGPSVAPPQEIIIQVRGGADYNRAVALDGGVLATGAVQDQNGAGVPAYIRFIPVASPYAFVETFSASNGTFSVQVLPQPHNVLVVPMKTTVAPKLIAQWMVGTTLLAVDQGTTITGTVLGPTGAAIVGAKVQLTINGTPSTFATTTAAGFTVLAEPIAGANVTIEVVPPSASGLPRLVATSTSFDLSQPVAVAYASSVATCNIQSSLVRRNVTPLANTVVTIVGTPAAIGTVKAGAGAAVQASGQVHIVTSTDANGHVLSTLVPRAPLSAVVNPGPSDYAVASFDTTTCPASPTIDAPAMTPVSSIVQNFQGTVQSGARVEVTPTGALALAGVAPFITTSDFSGTFVFSMASGGHYDVRVDSPSGHGAPMTLLNQSATMPATIALPKALLVSGTITVAGSANPVAGAAVQILCTNCAGLDIDRPLAETASDGAGSYAIAVLDPGTM